MEPASPSDAPWKSGLRGAREHVVPGLVLQLFALALVVGYYQNAEVHAALSRVSEARERSGFGLGILSTALFGGLLPFLYIHFAVKAPDGRPRYNWGQGFCLTAFWAYKGLEVDLWYRIQAHVFGAGHGAATIAIKVFMDQFVYCPVLAVPLTTAVYQAVDDPMGARAVLGDIAASGWYRRRVIPILISNLGVWIPAVAIVYCLPTPLQLPLQNIVLCFYTLIVAHQVMEHREAPH